MGPPAKFKSVQTNILYNNDDDRNLLRGNTYVRGNNNNAERINEIKNAAMSIESALNVMKQRDENDDDNNSNGAAAGILQQQEQQQQQQQLKDIANAVNEATAELKNVKKDKSTEE